MDVTANATKAPGEFWDLMKKYWVFAILAICALFVIAMAKKNTILGWFTSRGSSVAGDKLPAWLRKFLIGAAAIAVMGAAICPAEAFAAVCCATQAAPPETGGILHTVWTYIAGGAGIFAFGLTQFGAPDAIDLVETHGGPELAVADRLAAVTPKSLYAKTATHATKEINGRRWPLVATELTVEVKATVVQSAGGTTLEDDDLARLLAYLEIQSPYMGNLTEQKSCTGPILDLVTRFIGEAFERSGEAPVQSLTCPVSSTTSYTVVKYFTKPMALKFLDKPLSTAPWLGLLHNTVFNMGLAADDCLASTSASATVSGTRYLRGSISYVAVPIWYYPLVPFDRVDYPASGSNGIEFRNFGSPGPNCTVPIDWVHTMGQLSSLKGLPGNITFEKVTKLLAPRFGLDNVTNIRHLVRNRLRAQFMGHIGGTDYANSGNYPVKTADGLGVMALDKLLFFLLQQPSLDMEIGNMLRMTSQDVMPFQYETSSDRTGTDAFYFGAVRAVSGAKVPEWRGLPYSKLGPAVDSVVDVRTGKTA
jgi:hypothetical protein